MERFDGARHQAEAQHPQDKTVADYKSYNSNNKIFPLRSFLNCDHKLLMELFFKTKSIHAAVGLLVYMAIRFSCSDLLHSCMYSLHLQHQDLEDHG